RNAYVDMPALASGLNTPGGFPAAWRVVNCLENHDIVYDGQEQRTARLADGLDPRSWYARSRARFAAGLLMAARGIPMLFMGQEFLEDKQWSDAVGFRPELLIGWDALTTDKVRQDYLRFMSDLVRLRRSFSGLRGESLRVSRAESLDRVIVVHRWIEGV